MPASSAKIRRRAPERLAAWARTGPLGHLYSALADAVVLGVTEALRRLRSHAPRSG